MSTTIEQRRAAIRAAEQEMMLARDEHQATQAAIRPAVSALYELRQANPDPARENEMLTLFGKEVAATFMSALDGRGLPMLAAAGDMARMIGTVLSNIDSPFAEGWATCLAADTNAVATQISLDAANERLRVALLAT